jgi:hypothetical protein
VRGRLDVVDNCGGRGVASGLSSSPVIADGAGLTPVATGGAPLGE